jgi:hypothetical protein
MKIIYVTQAHPSKNMPTGLLILICKIKIGKGNIIKFPLFRTFRAFHLFSSRR